MRFPFRLTPYGRLWRGMLILVVTGWLVLMIPAMWARAPLTWLDCLFTSTSAVCVTGLTVRSTGNDFTFLGQLVILLMIQIGGLGFMTLSSSVLMHLRRKATLGQYVVIRESLGRAAAEELPSLLWRCLRIVLIVEAFGAVLLFARFGSRVPEGMSWLGHVPAAAWQAVFHSVSAFCNAGFSVWDTSLSEYAYDGWTNIVMGGLIVLGGLGFFVLADVEAWLRSWRAGQRHGLQFQSRVVLLTSAGLILAGAILIWLGERTNPLTLADKPFCQEWMVPLFHSITARTAGFFTVDVRNLSIFSVAVTIILMFIGASPGSTGGGVKTTTFAVVATLALGSLRSSHEPNFRGRSFGQVTIRSAVALLFAGAGLVVLGGLFLMLVETGGTPLQEAQTRFVGLLFEAGSAFGTVGLSTGVTPDLTAASKFCLIVLMFVGRIGPLGLISATLRAGARPEIQYPYEDIQIG